MTQQLLGQGIMTYIILLLVGALMTEPWRWAGVWLARDLQVDSEIFRWIKAVSTALVSGLVARMVVFPIGALADIPLMVRLGAFGLSVMIYFFAGRNIFWSVLGGTTALFLVAIWLGM